MYACSPAQQIFDVRPNPVTCECRGSGWLSSFRDTWHPCPLHNAGMPHPDSDEDDDDGLNFKQHVRRAYVFYANELQAFGVKDVNKAVRNHFGTEPETSVEWVNAIEEVWMNMKNERDFEPVEEYYDDEERARQMAGLMPPPRLRPTRVPGFANTDIARDVYAKRGR